MRLPGAALSALLTFTVAQAADSPAAWLDRMSRAVEHLSYKGQLVHVNETDTSVLSIVHRSRNGEVAERITSVDMGREIIRTNDEVIFILPDKRTVLVEARDDRNRNQSPLRANLPGAIKPDRRLYGVAFDGVESIAGRRAQIVAIRPLDPYRYGYRISIDRQTGMPLKTQLLDEDGRALEQIFFSAIRFQASIADKDVQPSVKLGTLTMLRFAPAGGQAENQPAESWGSADLPPGFRMTSSQAKLGANLPAGLQQVVYSDGLATVSVFIEPAVAASEQAEGLSRIGAANAYSTTANGIMVTAIGEVPAQTVEKLARSARSAPAPSAR